MPETSCIKGTSPHDKNKTVLKSRGLRFCYCFPGAKTFPDLRDRCTVLTVRPLLTKLFCSFKRTLNKASH